ncbi:uncharacterized protein BT62DRAFT_1034463, partial [Guyanagaster necrorhizus]
PTLDFSGSTWIWTSEKTGAEDTAPTGARPFCKAILSSSTTCPVCALSSSLREWISDTNALVAMTCTPSLSTEMKLEQEMVTKAQPSIPLALNPKGTTSLLFP